MYHKMRIIYHSKISHIVKSPILKIYVRDIYILEKKLTFPFFCFSLDPQDSFSLSLGSAWLNFSVEQSVNSRGKFSRRTTSFPHRLYLSSICGVKPWNRSAVAPATAIVDARHAGSRLYGSRACAHTAGRTWGRKGEWNWSEKRTAE